LYAATAAQRIAERSIRSRCMSVSLIEGMVVDARGTGDAILFIHGLGGTMNAWTPLLPAFNRFRCIRPELPGAGRSHKAYALGAATPHGGKISVETHVDALLRACEALGVARAHVAGHSFGTIIGLHLAVKAPDLVRSLSLFGAMAQPVPQQRENMRARAALARQQGMFETAQMISDVALSASTKETQPVTVAYVRETVLSQDAEGFARNCFALADAQSAELRKVDCPALIINGDEDVVTPLSGARWLADQLKSARVEVLNRCGHWPMQERSVESQRLMRDFIDRIR
jgi:3-oxoadipate enol-lactonase